MRSLAKLIRRRFDVLKFFSYQKTTENVDCVFWGGGFII
jgi:hypothetical protein